MNGCRRAVDCTGKWDVSYTSTLPRTETIRIRIPRVVRGTPGGANVRNDRYHVLEIKQQQQQHKQPHTRLTTIFSGTTQVSQYQKGKTNLDFTEARDSEWQWHQLGHMQVCTALQTDDHASTPSLSFYRPDALPAIQPTASSH